MVAELKEDYELKIKIELINDGFLIYSPTGVQFRESLLDAVDVAVEEIEDWSAEIFRLPFCEDDAVELKKKTEIKRRIMESIGKEEMEERVAIAMENK